MMSILLVVCTFISWMYYRYNKVGGILNLLYFRHKKLFPPGSSWEHPNKYLYLIKDHNVEHIKLDGVCGNIGAWYVCKKDVTTPKVLFILCHGIKYSRGSSCRVQLCNLLANQGYAIITFDYRGFGDSDGIPSPNGLVEDTMLVYDYAKSMFSYNIDIFIWGHSLGGGPSLRVANILTNDYQLKGVILDATFYDAKSMIVHKAGKWVLLFLNKFYKDNLESLFENWHALDTLNSSISTLHIHSIGDNAVPYKYGERLYKESVEQRWSLFLKTEFECGHNSNYNNIRIPIYLEKFINGCRERRQQYNIKN